MYRNWTETITNERGIWKLYYSTKRKNGNYPYLVECIKNF
jgi:hypothetical protein